MRPIGKLDWSLKEMRALHHVVTLGTVTAAATRMGLSQPAVSRLLASLESKLSQPLFERQGRGLVPTRSALDFCTASARVFDAIEGMQQNLAVSNQVETLRVAAPPTFARGFLQQAVALFLEANINATIQVDVRSSPSIIGMVSEGAVDVGITDTALTHEAVRDQPFRKAAMACFLRRDHPLTANREINVAEAGDLELIGLTHRHATRAYIDNLLRSSGHGWRMIVETSTAASAVSFVRETGAVSFLSPFPVAGDLPPEVTFRPLHGGLTHISRFIYPARIGLRPLTRRFMRAVTAVSEHHDGWSEALGPFSGGKREGDI
ncbi:LysR family transcriptional regulator [Magnetospira sp. QH-2]|uniref:LysR family transcriptional regulator n=1 Tax=Magnetospira sp. (strain QH-2) TaxID=1288970 RepID=UPI0003E80AC9|nr:LysR family transcriptional regulator [Magnetospira sp. QH-2]CCQ73673.1 Putative transcriptional regulator, LysR family protein [Magnetospira sp. QH-2]